MASVGAKLVHTSPQKHASRIPVLIAKTRTTTSLTTTTSTTTTATTTITTSTTTTTTCSVSTVYTSAAVTTTTSSSSTPKKSVTLTLLPLPAIRKSSFSSYSDKKIYGILKPPSLSIEPKNPSFQNLHDSKEDVGSTQPDVASSVPDLIQNVILRRDEESNKGRISILELKKCLSPVKVVQPHHEGHQKVNADHTEVDMTSNFNKRDSFSDDTASSLLSYSSTCGEANCTFASEDTRWSSTTSGYESDDTLVNFKPYDKLRKSLIPTKGSRIRKAQLVTTPWLNFKEIDFTNSEFLTEEEILALNARLERLFDVYKKIERDRISKAVGKTKPPLNNNNKAKFAHIKPKVQSNPPKYTSKPITFPRDETRNVADKTKKNFAFKPEIQKQGTRKEVKQGKSKIISKKEFSNHLKTLKNCFSNNEGIRNQPQRHHGDSHKSLGRQTEQEKCYTMDGSRSRHQAQRTTKPDADHHRDLNGARSSHSKAPSTTRNIENDLKQVRAGIESYIKKKSARSKPEAPPPSSPRFASSAAINKMPNFKCPRVRKRRSELSERKLNQTVAASSIQVDQRWRESRPDDRRTDDDSNIRRSNPTLLTMKLPKRLSKEEMEQVRRSSSRSLVGHGLLGSSLFVEKQIIPSIRTNISKSLTSGFTADSRVDDGNVGRQLLIQNRQMSSHYNFHPKEILPSPSVGSSLSSVQSSRGFTPKRGLSKIPLGGSGKSLTVPSSLRGISSFSKHREANRQICSTRKGTKLNIVTTF